MLPAGMNGRQGVIEVMQAYLLTHSRLMSSVRRSGICSASREEVTTAKAISAQYRHSDEQNGKICHRDWG